METSGKRIERDTMGEMEVPEDALWGASTQRAVLNFPVSGEVLDPALIHAYGLIKWAAATGAWWARLAHRFCRIAKRDCGIDSHIGGHTKELPTFLRLENPRDTRADPELPGG